MEGLLKAIGLPFTLPDVRPDDILDTIFLDKKVRGKELVFVLPREISRVEVIKGISPELVRKILNYQVIKGADKNN